MSILRRTPRALIVVAGALIATVVSAEMAGAHAIVADTVPAIDSTVARPPAQVVMRFNEPVELAFGAVRVYDTNRRRVDIRDARHQGRADTVAVDLEPSLADGTYTVTWRVVSADGHPIHEAFVFHIGAPGARPEGIARELLAGETGAGRVEGGLAGAARWLTFASLLALVGAVGFVILVYRRAPLADAEGQRRFWRRWRRIVALSLAGAAVGTVAAYVLQGAMAGDLPLGEALAVDVWQEVARTRFGRVALGRLGMLVVIGVVLWRLRHRFAPTAPSVGAARHDEELRGVPAAVVAVGAVALAATLGLGSHAGTTSPVALNLAADIAHVTAAAAWVGGLVVLALAVFPAARFGGGPSNAAPLVARFSDLALVAVAALVASGLVRSWVEVRELTALDEPYGVVLLAKAGVVVPILAAGYVNNRWLKPRLIAVDAATTTATVAWRRLRRLVGAEVALAAVVVALTAVLVNLVPARISAGVEGPFVTDVRLGTYRLNVLVDPSEVGANEVHLTATTDTGAPAPIEAMTVQFRMPDDDIGPLVAEGVHLAHGHFVVQGRQLSVPGRWVLEIVARTGRFDEARTETTLRVH